MPNLKKDIEPYELVGSWSYTNWKAERAGKPEIEAIEVPIYTDAVIVGNVTEGFGPYQFVNTDLKTPDPSKPSIIVRIAEHALDPRHYSNVPRVEASGSSNNYKKLWHGGGSIDEITSLMSLILGVRIRYGGEILKFLPGSDSEATSSPWSVLPLPVFSRSEYSLTVPSAIKVVDLNKDLSLLQDYPLFEFQVIPDLLRCARLYQDALSIVESQPQLAWLFLVSAVETAATPWKHTKDTDVNIFKAFEPELATYLENLNIDGLLDKIAERVAPTFGSADKFRKFLLEFYPPELPERPTSKKGLVDWVPDNLTKAFSKIYNYRSKALHSGHPFPAPMCEAPEYILESVPYEKPRPGGFAIGPRWSVEDLPMYLFIFEYIVRNSLLKWWTTLGKQET